MADTASVRTGLNTLIAENWSNQVMDTLFDRMPLMQVFFGRRGDKNSPVGLGIPNSDVLLTGMKDAQIRRKEIVSSLVYQPLIHHSLPAEGDGKVMTLTDSMPTRNAWQTNSPVVRFKRPAVKWCEIADPCKVPNEHIRHTKRAAKGERNGWEAIGDLFRVERNDVLGQHIKRWNQLFWGTYTGTVAATGGSPTDETADKWDAIHSFKAALDDGTVGSVYCGIDRDVAGNEWWKGNYVSAQTAPVFRDMIRYANYGAPGLAKKYGPLDCILVGGDLFPIALSEAEAKGGQVVPAGTEIADFGKFGFKRDTVRIDNTWIVYDPECPAAAAVGLKLDTWTVAIHPDSNFTQTDPTDQQHVEGGDDAHTWTIRTKMMVVCEVPSQNIYWNNVS